MDILMTNPNGWQKSVKPDKAITRVGSSPVCDIQLDSSDISPYQIEIIYLQEKPSACKITNLGKDEISLVVSGERQRLAPFFSIELQDQDEILLAGNTLHVQMPLQSSSLIGASLEFSSTVLSLRAPVVGRLTLKNNGDQSACQFQVAVWGVPPDCYQIGPAPLLYPGGQDEVIVRFFHHCIAPPAGRMDVRFEISAPLSYPGEKVVIRQPLYVTPIYNPWLDLQDDIADVSRLNHELPAPEQNLSTDHPVPQIRSGLQRPEPEPPGENGKASHTPSAPH